MKPEFLLTVTIKNNRLHQARLASGLTVAELCERAGIGLGSYYNLVSCKEKAMRLDGGWRTAAKRLAEFFKMCEDDLFPPATMRVKATRSSREISEGEIYQLCAPEEQARMMLPAPDMAAEDSELRDFIDKALKTLTPREERIIRRRFFDGETLEEIGEDFEVTRNRIRQIEARALRKLRHPAHHGALREFFEDELEEEGVPLDTRHPTSQG